MAFQDLGNLTALQAAWQAVLNNSVPDESIEPDDHFDLFEKFVGTCIGLNLGLRADPNTGGYSIEVTDGDLIYLNNSGFKGGIDNETLTTNRTWQFPDKDGVIAMLSDISAPYVHPNHSGDVTSVSDGPTTAQPVMISGKPNLASPVGTEKVLVEDGGVLKYSLVSSLVSPDTNIGNAEQTLTANRTVTMGGFNLTFDGNTTFTKGNSTLFNQYNFIAKDVNDLELFKIGNSGILSTRGNGISFLNNTTHAIRANTSTANRGVIGFYDNSDDPKFTVATRGVGINRIPVSDVALVLSMPVAGTGFFFSDQVGSTFLIHSNGTGGNRFGVGRTLSTGTTPTDGILNIQASRADAASIKIDSGVDPTGTNLSFGSLWFNSNTFKHKGAGEFNGAGSTNATTGLLVKNVLNQDTFRVDDSGGFGLGLNVNYLDNTNVAIGNSITASADSSIVIGQASTSSGLVSVSIGGSNSATGDFSTVIGYQSTAIGNESIAIGRDADATTTRGISIGALSNANNNTSMAVGVDSGSSGIAAQAFGNAARANGLLSLALGTSMVASAVNSIMIGCGNVFRTNSTSNSLEVNFDEANSTFRIGKTVDGWLNGAGNFGVGLNAGISEKLHVNGNIRSDGDFVVNGNTGFTGTGAYTNFTIEGGIITAAS